MAGLREELSDNTMPRYLEFFAISMGWAFRLKCVCCKFLVLLKMTFFVFSKLIDSLEALQ